MCLKEKKNKSELNELIKHKIKITCAHKHTHTRQTNKHIIIINKKHNKDIYVFYLQPLHYYPQAFLKNENELKN